MSLLFVHLYLLYYICKSFDFVGKMIVNNKFGTMASADKTFEYDYVCLPPNKQIPLHSQGSWELSCVITGAGTRLLSDVSESFTDGEVVLIPPEVQHCWYFNKDVTDERGNIENVTIFFAKDFLNNVACCFPELAESAGRLSDSKNAIVFDGEIRDQIYLLMLRMREESAEKRILTFLEILLLAAKNQNGRVIAASKPRSRREVKMSQIKSYINCNYTRDITLEEVAMHIGMNKSSLCTFVKKESGLTFVNYLNEYRLLLAVEKLKDSELRVSEIGVAVGIADTPYFCRIFKRKYGMTPTEYRNYIVSCK